jgi:hypothetical protein
MSEDLRVFRELILWLWQQKKPWEYESSNQTINSIVQSSKLQTNTFYADTELEAYLPSEEKVDASFPKNRYLCLSPVTESRIMIPRITLKCDFGKNIPEIRCRLELFLLANDTTLQSLGYRFESPEGKNDQGAGVHHYYHIQIIQPPTSRLDWLPDTQPAFPINADNPVKLILSLLISLYGRGYLGTILKESRIKGLEEYVRGIPCMDFAVFEWYKLIEVGNPVKHTEGYRITSNEGEFETFIRGRYAGCNIKGITRTSYDALPTIQKKQYPST